MNYTKSHLHIAVQPVFSFGSNGIFSFLPKNPTEQLILFFIVMCMLRKLSAKNILGETKINILIYTTPILPIGRKKHKNIDYDQLRNPCDKKSARKYDAGRQFGILKHRNISKHSAQCLLRPNKKSSGLRTSAPYTTYTRLLIRTLHFLTTPRALPMVVITNSTSLPVTRSLFCHC